MKKFIILFMAACLFAACKKDEVTLESIAVITQPTKTIYTVDELFDPAGIVVTATYSDKSTKPITVTKDMLEYDFSSAGMNKSVTITYEGKTTTVTGIIVNPIDSNFAGAGTSDKPFEIGTPAQLAKLAELVNARNENYNDKYYKLTASIDLSDYGTGFNDGKGWIPIGRGAGYGTGFPAQYFAFRGNFNGNGYKVIGLFINNTTDFYREAGLFGRIFGGTVKNLGVEADITGYSAVGGVVGYLDGSIENCYVTGKINGLNSSVGGVVGYLDPNGSMTNCYATCEVSGNEYVGGVVGNISASANISNCYATSAVRGNNRVGGVAGWGGNMENCAAINQSITRALGSNTGFGRIVSAHHLLSTITNNVALENMQALGGITFGTGEANNIDGADITAVQAKTASFWTTTTPTWTGWDTSIWDISDGKLPILRNVGGNQTTNNPPEHLQ